MDSLHSCKLVTVTESPRSDRLYETGPFLRKIPGNKLPGYYHLVPPGHG